MTLAEALKASKNREAIASKDSTILHATDAGISIISKRHSQKKSWADLLPHERELLQEVDWKPRGPKPPLQQLAETLTDWSDDD